MAGSTNSYVIDASSALSFLLPDESEPFIEEIFEQYRNGEILLIAPVLLPFEVFNGLKTAILKKRIKSSIAQQLANKFLDLYISLEEVELTKVLKLAVLRNLTFYDASYVYLARKNRIKLLTLDENLKQL